MCVWAAPARLSVGRRIIGINQGKATAICLFNVGDGYSLDVSAPLKQLASFQRVESLTVAEACVRGVEEEGEGVRFMFV